MDKRPVVAVTGASGFIGHRLLRALSCQDVTIRALARSFSKNLLIPHHKYELILGDLEQEESLRRLLSDANCVIHIAGLTHARRSDEFFKINEGLTKCLLEGALRYCPQAQFILISSLAAREPSLSPYAASKYRGEEQVKSIWRGRSWVIIRPPAVYGPGDKELMPIFKAARAGILPLPLTAKSKIAMIHVDDLASGLTNVIHNENLVSNCVIEISDKNRVGYGAKDLKGAFSTALKKPLFLILLPRVLVQLAAYFNQFRSCFIKRAPILMPHKVPELFHEDWSCNTQSLQSKTGWSPRFTLEEGLIDTLKWHVNNIKKIV